MTVLSKAEDLNGEIEDKAAKVCTLSEKILCKLRKFKDNQFRPRIQGYDSDSDQEELDERGEKELSKTLSNNKVTIKGLSKVGRSPTKYLNKINSQNDEEDNIALLKLIRGGYIDQRVMADLINNVVTGFNQQLQPKVVQTNKTSSRRAMDQLNVQQADQH